MRLLTSLVKALPLNFVLLAPPAAEIPDTFKRVEGNPRKYRRYLHKVQELRGKVYLADGAIQEWQLKPDGRHEQALDYEGWHILALDGQGNVCGSVRYRQHPNTVAYHQLGVYESTFASHRDWSRMLQLGVERELIAARRQGVAYAEVGGWVIAPERRRSPEALRVALANYAFAEAMGGARGITTATVRHRSSSILRRLGGRSLHAGAIELPPYYDSRYRCEMEVLQFDSGSLNPAYRSLVDDLRAYMSGVAVICGERLPQSVRWISDRAAVAAYTAGSRAMMPA